MEYLCIYNYWCHSIHWHSLYRNTSKKLMTFRQRREGKFLFKFHNTLVGQKSPPSPLVNFSKFFQPPEGYWDHFPPPPSILVLNVSHLLKKFSKILFWLLMFQHGQRGFLIEHLLVNLDTSQILRSYYIYSLTSFPHRIWYL